MKKIKITVEYDGRNFAGWQRQKNNGILTVQGVLEKALSCVCAHPVFLHGSGRTDAGVHARAQIAHFSTESDRRPYQIVKGCNCLLPPEVAILEAEEVLADFHARFSAKGKIYDYDFSVSPTRRPLLHKRTWWVGNKLNWAAMEKALPAIIGEHDFAAFRSLGSETRTTVRQIRRAEISFMEDDLVRMTLEGNGFLRHMVRAIAGTLFEIGRGQRPESALADLIAAKDRSLAGTTAPADGLYLCKVLY